MSDFEVYINGELVHTIEGTDSSRVSEVKLLSSQGAAGNINVPMEMSRIDLEITVRDTLESNYLDLNSYDAQRERAEEIEKKSADKVAEGRRQMEEEAAKQEEEAAEIARQQQEAENESQTESAIVTSDSTSEMDNAGTRTDENDDESNKISL